MGARNRSFDCANMAAKLRQLPGLAAMVKVWPGTNIAAAIDSLRALA